MSDLISRQAAIERATKEHDFFRGAVTVSDKARRDELLNVMCWLGELPPAQPEPKRGKWIDKGITGDWQYQTDGRGSSWHEWQCDQCKDMVTKRSFYCPNCGADMREVTT